MITCQLYEFWHLFFSYNSLNPELILKNTGELLTMNRITKDINCCLARLNAFS